MAAQLAQVNVARLRYPYGDPRLRGFFTALDRVNAAADAAPGFVWRHQDPNGHLRGGTLLDDPTPKAFTVRHRFTDHGTRDHPGMS